LHVRPGTPLPVILRTVSDPKGGDPVGSADLTVVPADAKGAGARGACVLRLAGHDVMPFVVAVLGLEHDLLSSVPSSETQASGRPRRLTKR
jgi:hypothetical protein